MPEGGTCAVCGAKGWVTSLGQCLPCADADYRLALAEQAWGNRKAARNAREVAKRSPRVNIPADGVWRPSKGRRPRP